MSLKSLIGQSIMAKVPALSEGPFSILKLLGVEHGGIWVESQEFINRTLGYIGVAAAAPESPVLFLPYHQIQFLLTLDSPALSETSLGQDGA
ncbi:MAG TPA: hypothetical protein VG206_26190 [Terriglobia bacterium]|nr:hypothetical protein [Terriglobia bacterium]